MDYDKVLLRLEKITKTINQLIVDKRNLQERLRKRDEPLVQKVKKLEAHIKAMEYQFLAQEHVLQSISAERDELKNGSLQKESTAEHNG